MELLGHIVTLLRNFETFLKWLSHFSTSLSTLVIECRFDYNHPSGHEVIFHCTFDLNVLNDHDVNHLFMCLLAIYMLSLKKYPFAYLFICVFIYLYIEGREREGVSEQGRGRGRRRERISSRLHTQRGAPCKARFHNCEIMT